MSVPLVQILKAALNPRQLARGAITNPRLVPDIFKGLGADKGRIKLGCSKALCLLSELRPDLLYPYFDFFVGLLDHGNKIIQWNAAFVLSHLVRVDNDDKFLAVFEKYFSPIPGSVMITAANVIQGGARIAQAKPHLADRIAGEMVKVAKARYRTPECRNVAIGHAILALAGIAPLLRNPAPAVQFIRKQARNPRAATRKKAEQFLKSHLSAASRRGRTLPT